MSLKLMYITNKPEIAEVAQKAGVDRIFIDLEVLGKEERQGHIDSVKSRHSLEDIARVKSVMSSSELLVRVNPIHEGSEVEIDTAIKNGADILMLPMWKTKEEVATFIKYVNGRAKVLLLLETKEANENIEDIIIQEGIDEVHIGLNDLHLSYGKTFMFEMISDGTVEHLCEIFQKQNIPYGFGGVGSIGYGMLPAEQILCEHYRLGSSAVILSRAFLNTTGMEEFTEGNIKQMEEYFTNGVKLIRAYEQMYREFDSEMFQHIHKAFDENVEKIVNGIQERNKYENANNRSA